MEMLPEYVRWEIKTVSLMIASSAGFKFKDESVEKKENTWEKIENIYPNRES